MQRLALFGARGVLPLALATNVRFNSNYNKRVAEKMKRGDDDERWLEAELDENILAPEERYARQKDLERMRLLLKKVNEKHDKKLETVKTARDEEISSLKKQMQELQERLSKMKDD